MSWEASLPFRKIKQGCRQQLGSISKHSNILIWRGGSGNSYNNFNSSNHYINNYNYSNILPTLQVSNAKLLNQSLRILAFTSSGQWQTQVVYS
jgi:hypothetical protein